MTIVLVIPANAGPDDAAFPDRPKDDSPTWQKVADESGCERIELFGSQWCVDNAIDGLGVCTEASGQESDAERAAREQREADSAMILRDRTAGDDTVQRVMAALVRKGVITVDDVAAETKETAADVVADVAALDVAVALPIDDTPIKGQAVRP